MRLLLWHYEWDSRSGVSGVEVLFCSLLISTRFSWVCVWLDEEFLVSRVSSNYIVKLNGLRESVWEFLFKFFLINRPSSFDSSNNSIVFPTSKLIDRRILWNLKLHFKVSSVFLMYNTWSSVFNSLHTLRSEFLGVGVCRGNWVFVRINSK